MRAMQEQDNDGPSLVSTRTMEIVVALLLLVVSAIVITDSARLGFRWREVEGPASGYFPFYIGLLIAISSLVNLFRAISSKEAPKTFVSKPAFRQVLAVLVPLCFYVLVVGWIGIYVASAIYIALFMWYFGRYPLPKGFAIGVAVSLALFAMFEIWFLVPLPKGPIEDFFGF
jgi:putative tricarboxylic transport membrane protein